MYFDEKANSEDMYLADSGGVVVQIDQSKWILEDYIIKSMITYQADTNYMLYIVVKQLVYFISTMYTLLVSYRMFQLRVRFLVSLNLRLQFQM